MKIRESGMPDEQMWSSFFKPDEILKTLGLQRDTRNLVEFGCGYGTFTISAARMISGIVHAFDIENDMIEATRKKANDEGLKNTRFYLRDFVGEGTGLPDSFAEYVMMFNILHAEEPLALLKEAWRILISGGRIAIIHWNYDESTPRGPSMEIRPTSKQCSYWIAEAGFQIQKPEIRNLPPFHYGILGVKPEDD